MIVGKSTIRILGLMISSTQMHMFGEFPSQVSLLCNCHWGSIPCFQTRPDIMLLVIHVYIYMYVCIDIPLYPHGKVDHVDVVVLE